MGIFSSIFKKSYSKQELKMLAKQAKGYLKIYDDSQKLFQETKNPDVFFMRLDLAIKTLKDLQKLIDDTNNAIKYQGDSIPKMVKRLESHRNEITSLFIERYFYDSRDKARKLKTEKGKQNSITKSYNKIMEYSNYLTEEQKEKIGDLWNTI